ncbi:MAG TPA: hypothetical protein VGB17_02870 [Pyrinomonadaceae bacterium]|jgi:hypothetical protein
MSFSFDDSLSSALSRIRFDLGDTVEDGHLLEDETIDGVLARFGNDERRAKIELAKGLIARFSLQPSSVSLPDNMGSILWENRLSDWKELVKRLDGGFRVLKATRGAERSEYKRGEWWTP